MKITGLKAPEKTQFCEHSPQFCEHSPHSQQICPQECFYEKKKSSMSTGMKYRTLQLIKGNA